mmetsp:Transcript_14819/g.33717  ORF Transcript_14819/g.33717 Transcript_14819/m.33717 type:complete len:943 (-) Transcript_14819:16-2844(-)
MQGRAVRALAARRPAAGDSQELYAGGKRNSLSSLQSTTKDSEAFRATHSETQAVKGGQMERAMVPKGTMMEWVRIEMDAERACKSLPFTFIFWLVFIATQWSHRDVGSAYELQKVGRDMMGRTRGVNSSLLTDTSLGYNGGQVVRSQDFISLLEVGDAFEWLEESLIPALWIDSSGSCPECFINIYNRVVGGVRLQQTRLKVLKDCPGNQRLSRAYDKECFSETRDHETGPFGGSLDTQSGFVSDEGVYTYWLDIHQNHMDAIQHVAYLDDNSWLSDATDVFDAQVLLYNGQLGFLIFIDARLRLHRGGHLKGEIIAKALPTKMYHNAGVVFGDLVMAMLLLGMALDETRRIFNVVRTKGFRSYLHVYAIVNWAVVTFGLCMCLYFVYLVYSLERLAEDISTIPEPSVDEPYAPGAWGWVARHLQLDYVYDEAGRLKMLLEVSETMAFWYTLLIVMKFFEAFSGSPRLAIMAETLTRAFVDLFHFCIVFGTIFITFALGGYVLFGQQLEEWASFDRAITTSFRALVGDFNYNAMFLVSPINATVWFWTFMLLNFLIMLNMLLAIIMEVYCEVKDESRSEQGIWQTIQALINSARLRAAGASFERIRRAISSVEGEHVHLGSLMGSGLSKKQAEIVLKELYRDVGFLEEAPKAHRPGGRNDGAGGEGGATPHAAPLAPSVSDSLSLDFPGLDLLRPASNVGSVQAMVALLQQQVAAMEELAQATSPSRGAERVAFMLPPTPSHTSGDWQTPSLPGAVEESAGTTMRSSASEVRKPPSIEEVAKLMKAVAEAEVGIAKGKAELEAMKPPEPNAEHEESLQREREVLLQEKTALQKEMQELMQKQVAKLQALKEGGGEDPSAVAVATQEVEALRALTLRRLAENKAKVSSLEDSYRLRGVEEKLKLQEFETKRAASQQLIAAFERERDILTAELERLKASSSGFL